MKKNRQSAFSTDSSEEASVNLTPLIDVVFVVLIMFIIIAPMLEIDKVQLAHSAQKGAKEAAFAQGDSPITIHVHADNSIYLNSKRILEKELLERLKVAKQLYPQKVPQLFHDKKAQFGTYQTVKNAAEAAGFEQIDVILQPE